MFIFLVKYLYRKQTQEYDMSRTQAIALIRAYAAKGDIKACTSVYVENRISRAVYDQAVADGRAFGAFVAKRDAAGSAA